jgi:periplasmic divalent cation tolerance protein
VNLVPGVRSLFRWKGAIVEEREVLLIAKTERRRLARFRALIEKQHPYEVPELLALSVADGTPAYLAWLHASLGAVTR